MTKNKSRPLTFLLAGLLWTGFAQAQESVSATGGDATGTGGTVAFSVGQVFYASNTGSTGAVDAGVQQAYEIFSVGITETAWRISLLVFPNPTSDHLNLQISDYNNEKLSYQLYDMQGKLLINGPIVAQQTQINMTSLPPATYFLHVVNPGNKQVQSFKIIKTR